MTKSAPQGYYAASAAPCPNLSLSGDHEADVCVIGGGYTGLSAALHLAANGAKVVVLEAEEIGFGASGRNGGQIHSGHRKDQAELEAWLGVGHARNLWSLAEEAKALIRSLVHDHAIACDLKDGLVIAAHDQSALRALEDDTAHLHDTYGYVEAQMMDATLTASALGTDIYPGARLDQGGGHLHPLKFARGLAQAARSAGALLFERSRVCALEEQTEKVFVRTDAGTVQADRIILACDAFTGELVPALARYIGHVESFIVATAQLPETLANDILPADVAVADTRHVLDYYRKSADGRLLFAGRESYWNVPNDIAGVVRPRMLRVFPQLAGVPIEYAWSGTVGITRTRMPHFGRIGTRILFGHGYSGHGVALATLGGMALAEAALGQTDRFDVLAHLPAKPFPGGALLRKPMITAGLVWYKLMDAI